MVKKVLIQSNKLGVIAPPAQNRRINQELPDNNRANLLNLNNNNGINQRLNHVAVNVRANQGATRVRTATLQRLSATRYARQRRLIEDHIANERANGRQLDWGEMLITALAQHRGRLVNPPDAIEVPQNAFFQQIIHIDRERRLMENRNEEEQLRLANEMHPVNIEINGTPIPGLTITVNVGDIRRMLNLPMMNLNGLDAFEAPELPDPAEIPVQRDDDHNEAQRQQDLDEGAQ